VKNYKECATKQDLERILAAGDIPILREGYWTIGGSATVRASDSATVRASDSATVRASGSATVRASDSATVQASDSATVQAWDSATVRASGSATVEASPYVAVTKHGTTPKITGGVVIQIPRLDNTETWLKFYGITPTKAGKVTLFKAVSDEFKSGYEWDYSPGSKPTAFDFEATNECGKGLHLCARPTISKKYMTGATRYVACTVNVSEIVVIHEDGESNKVKVPRILKCVECDEDGKAVRK